MTLDIGDVYGPNEGCEIFVYNDAGALTVATVVLTVYAPNGAEATPTVTAHATTGRYQSTITPTLYGEHALRWVATVAGEGTSTEWATFRVRNAQQEETGGPFPYGLASWESRVS